MMASRFYAHVQCALRRGAFLSACAALFWGSFAQADDYQLVAEDKLTLRVVEWRSVDAQYASWEALGGIYTVDTAGNVSIPVAGQVRATGKTTEQLATDIAEQLAAKAGFQTKPFIAIEVAQHAPIFVTGTVQTPGRYPFEAGMTVMKAVSIAGGFLRSRDGSSIFERDRIEAAGAYRTAMLNRQDLIIRKARLQAEITGATDFTLPEGVEATPSVEKSKLEELNLMRLRRIEIESQIDATEDLTTLYTHEIQSLEGKIESQKRQIASAKKELDSVNSLVSKGLTTTSRQYSLDRGLAETESSLLDLEIALTKARQSLSESQRGKANIINKHNAENQQELNTIEISIGKANIDIQVAQLLGEQAGYSAQIARSSADGTSLEQTQRLFKITRRNDDGTYREIIADATTSILPHDLVEVGFDLAGDTSTAQPIQHSSNERLPKQAISLPSTVADISLPHERKLAQ